MNKLEIEKNRLDLAYKRNLQLLNAILVIGIGSFVVYLAGFLFNPDKVFEYTILLFIVGGLTLIFYLNVNNNLKNISDRIGKLVG